MISCSIQADFQKRGESRLEGEVDLRPYINSLRHRWYLIVGTAIAFGMLAFIVSSIIAPIYEATALIIVDSRDIVQFDERFRDTSGNEPLSALPELAESDDILQTLLTQVTLDNVKHVEQLRQILTATSGNNASTITLSVSYSDPEVSAQIAATWADVFLEKANDIYYDYNGEQLQFYKNQLIDAESVLSTVENDLIEFQSANRGVVISNTLQAYSQRQINYLSAQTDLLQLQQDAEALLTSLNNSATDDNLSFAEQFMALLLQIRFYNSETEVPILLQPTESLTLTTENKTEQISLLENFLTILETQSIQASAELAEIEPLILELQQQLQATNIEQERLVRQLTIAQETYNALALKVQEENITSQNTGEGIRLASKPIVPNEPKSPQKLNNAIVGFLLGLIFATFFVILNQWWQIYNLPQQTTK